VPARAFGLGRDRMLIAASSGPLTLPLKALNFFLSFTDLVEQRVEIEIQAGPRGSTGPSSPLPLGLDGRRAVQPRRPSPAFNVQTLASSSRGQRRAFFDRLSPQGALRRSDWVRPEWRNQSFKNNLQGNRAVFRLSVALPGRRNQRSSAPCPLADVRVRWLAGHASRAVDRPQVFMKPATADEKSGIRSSGSSR